MFTFLLSSAMLCSEMLLVPTMISESKAGTEKLKGKQRKGDYDRNAVWRSDACSYCRFQRVAPHSLLAAESEDMTDVHRLPAEVPTVQTHPHRPVAQLTQGQGHSAEVQQATA